MSSLERERQLGNQETSLFLIQFQSILVSTDVICFLIDSRIVKVHRSMLNSDSEPLEQFASQSPLIHPHRIIDTLFTSV